MTCLKRFMCIVAVVALAASMNLSANADEYLFGFSGYDGQETLTLNTAVGGPFVLNTNGNQGWWSPNSSNSDSNSNYIVGNVPGADWNDFFVFNISDLSGQTVTSAVLSVSPFTGASTSGRTTQTYSLFDVSTPVNDLLAKGNNPDAAIYNDLGTGVNYGTYDVPVNAASTLNFALNASAINDINAAIAAGNPNFAIGGTLTGGVVPEPSSIALCGIGASLGLLHAWRRRRTSRAA